MQMKILVMLGSALFTVPAAQVASAAQPHRSHIANRAQMRTHQQWHYSNASIPNYTPEAAQSGVGDEALSPPTGH
jgi:hypothetical protein